MIDSTSIWGTDFRASFGGGKDNLGFSEITFEMNETNDQNNRKQLNTLVHFNNNVSYSKDADENGNRKASIPNDQLNDVNKDGGVNFGVQALVHPYNSTPLYAFNNHCDNDNNLNKLHQNFRNLPAHHTQAYIMNANKLERASPIQRSISNVSNSIPLCKLNKGKACRLFNECDQDCSEQEHEQVPAREFNKTVRYPMRVLIDGPYGMFNKYCL